MGSQILDFVIIALFAAFIVAVVWKLIDRRKPKPPAPAPRPSASTRPAGKAARVTPSEPDDVPYDRRTGEVLDDDYFEGLRARRARAGQVAIVRGKPLWKWIPTIDEMKRAGEYQAAADLTLECVDAMEHHSSIMGFESGAAGWYEKAAIIYRKLRDYDAEIEMIDRGLGYMPANPDLLHRRVKAVQLRDKAR